MKILAMISMMIISFSACSKEKAAAKKVEAKAVAKEVVKAEAPCDTKEDLLKKLEEKKKAEAEAAKPKGFSLQGGDTGCTIK